MGGTKTNIAKETNGNLEAIKTSVQLLDNAIAGSEMQVDVITMPAVTVTGVATETTQAAGNVLTGAVTETAPASDTASSGLNGRLQRIAQRITSLITALGSPFQAGGSIGNTSFGVNNASGASAVNIQDGGNSITVDGTIQDLRGDNTDMTITALNSLASSATVGWQSDRVGITSELDVLIGIKLDMANTAPANDKAVYVYLCPWYYDGTTYYASSVGTATLPTGSQGGCTIASSAPNNLKLLGVLAYSTADMVLQDSFSLSNTFGTALPDAWSIVVINFSGAAIAASGNKLMYKKINQQTA